MFLCVYGHFFKMKVLYGLEYGHALQDIKEASTVETTSLCGDRSRFELHFADIMSQSMIPIKSSEKNGNSCTACGDCVDAVTRTYRIGGLRWSLKEGCSMEDYSLFWIGPDNSAFANVVLTFNGCEIGIYRIHVDVVATRDKN